MFNNIGGKIKALAKIICWIGIICCIILAILYAYQARNTYGYIVAAVIAIFGSLASWIGSFLLYGFGELVDNSAKIEANTRK